jgi:hypothetical protein
MSTIVAKHVVGQSITREEAMYIIMIAAMVFGACPAHKKMLLGAAAGGNSRIVSSTTR